MRQGNREQKDTVNAKELTQKRRTGQKGRGEKRRRAMPLRLRLAEGRRHNSTQC